MDHAGDVERGVAERRVTPVDDVRRPSIASKIGKQHMLGCEIAMKDATRGAFEGGITRIRSHAACAAGSYPRSALKRRSERASADHASSMGLSSAGSPSASAASISSPWSAQERAEAASSRRDFNRFGLEERCGRPWELHVSPERPRESLARSGGR